MMEVMTGKHTSSHDGYVAQVVGQVVLLPVVHDLWG
jgi:hypothetical protein